jgi:serine/threonine protein kinase
VIEIDGYRDLEPIGHGGLGDVYRAVRSSTGSTVAIKVLRDVSDSSVAWHRTRRELTALVSLTGHAHVVQLLELLDLPTGPALVMEYAAGGSVGGLLAVRGDTLEVPEVVLIGRHAAAALVAAHEQEIVHRDLKPQNLLIDAYGQVKLCDFGIASLLRSEEFRTRTSALSMRYASPEDLDEDAEVGPPADVYSLGATLVHLAHGAPPTLKDRLAPWEPPSTDDAELKRLDAVIAACLEPTPSARPTATEVLERLESIDWTLASRCRALPVDAPPPTPPADADPLDPASSTSSSDAVLPIMSLDDGPVAAEPVVLDGHDTSARTVERRDRPALPPRPSSIPPHRRWPWVAAAVVGAAAIGVVVALLWPTDADAPAGPVNTEPLATTAVSSTTTLAEEAPSVGPTEVAETGEVVELVKRPNALAAVGGDDILWPFGEVGGCLVLVDGATELTPIDCDEPHDLQRFAVDELDADEFPADTSFDGDAVIAATDEACRQAFEVFVGVDEGTSRFEIAVTRPSAATWAGGDRGFQCLLGVQGEWLVGDAESSAE